MSSTVSVARLRCQTEIHVAATSDYMNLTWLPLSCFFWPNAERSSPFSFSNAERRGSQGFGILFILFVCRKTRTWLGTFEMAKDAARAYNEAARLMCGPRARTNFPYNPNVSQSSSKLLSATLTAKLHRSYVASLQMTRPSLPKPQRVASSPHADVSTSNSADTMLPNKKAHEEQES